MFNLTGTTLGRYQISARIGRGGMADVYKATHTRLGTQAAIKVLYSHLVEQEDFMVRFEREARAAAGLRHPNIVRVFDYDIENELSYIVMDYIDDGTLKEMVAGARQRGEYMLYPEVLRIFRQIAEALDYAHQQGMIHRDVKSANILLDQKGSAYLTDFGIAHIVSSTHLTSTGSLIGTPIYMSPEQCQGKKATTASDIYSLGMVLYEMLTGVVPFAEDTPLAVIHKHIYEPLPSPREIRAEISPELEGVLFKALAREPEDRYATVLEFLQAVASVLGDEPAQTVAVERPRVEPTTPSDPATREAPQDEVHSQDTVADLSPMDYMEPPDFDRFTPAEEPVPESQTDAVLPTVLEDSDERTAVEEEPVPLASEPREEPIPEDQAREAATVVMEEPLPPKQPASNPEKKKKRRFAHGWTLAIIAGVLLVILLVVAWASGVFSGVGSDDPQLCNSPDDCLQTAWHFKEQGDVERVRAALIRMENLIPPDRLRAAAFMFCEAGEIHLHMERPRPARDYFHRCLELAEDEDLRNYARDMLERIE